jgi:hypothetical protein
MPLGDDKPIGDMMPTLLLDNGQGWAYPVRIH